MWIESFRKRLFATSLAALLVLAAGAERGVALAAPLDKDGAETALKTGINALRSGDAATAISYLTPAISAHVLSRQRSALAIFHRAAAYQHIKDYQRAIADYNQSIALDVFAQPVLAMAFYNRGLCFESTNQSSAALNDFSGALAINSNFAQAYNARADILRKLGRHQDAIRDYQASLRHRHPLPHLSLYGQALSHAALRQKNLARKALERALVARPDFEPARMQLQRINSGAEIVQPDDSDIGNSHAGASDAGDEIVTGSIAPAASPRRAQRADAQGDTRVAAGRNAGATGSLPPGVATDAHVPGPGFEEAAAGPLAAGDGAHGFMLQLTAQRDEESARGIWRRLAGQHGDVLGQLNAYIQPANVEGKGVFYRLRAGPFASRDEVEQACRVLKARGASCFVARQ